MPKEGGAAAPEKLPTTTAWVSQKLRAVISARARKGETVDETLRRLLSIPVSCALSIPETLPGAMPEPTSIRIRGDTKAWIESKSRRRESFERVLRRLLGVSQKKEGKNGSR